MRIAEIIGSLGSLLTGIHNEAEMQRSKGLRVEVDSPPDRGLAYTKDLW